MIRTSEIRLIAYVSIALFLGCAANRALLDEHGQSMMGPPGVYTLVNLHPDNQRSRLYAVNFQQPGLIPVCSQVELLELKKDLLRFRVLKTNRTYDYINHKAAAEPFEDHLRRFFGPECPASEIEALSQIDQTGIRQGQALHGMSKRGVVFSLGPPPRHTTPDLDANQWLYWIHRFNRLRITFDSDGYVSKIQN
jgi:hypothetical protein